MTTLVVTPSRPYVEDEPLVREIVCLKAKITKHPDNCHHDYLDAVLAKHPRLRRCRVSDLAVTLTEGLRWGV